MKSLKINGFLVVLLSIFAVGPTAAQRGPAEKAPGRSMISIYRIAPGKHVEFLKWLAEREALDKEVGGPAGQVYAHIDGDSWDFIAISPMLEPVAQAELDKKLDAAAKKKGIATGPKAGIEIRQFLASHTDTIAAGPMTVAQMVDAVTK